MATFVAVEARNAVPTDGAKAYAFGSQACKGNNAILSAIPTVIKANEASNGR